MKYNTISTSSLASEGKKSSFTIYADMDISPNKVAYTEAEMSSIRGELEIVQKALKYQTKRCRQLVAEYTRKLQEKEHQYQSEKSLRDDQLAKVLRALLIFEARLRQEQKFINHQLNEKDYIIKKQRNDIRRLLSSQYCKSCNQYCISSPNLESLDSSSEYAIIDYQDHSSNFESLDSSSENYATLSEKSCNKIGSPIGNDNIPKSETEPAKSLFRRNRNKDSLGRKSRKVQHRKSIGTYFEVLKLRNANSSPLSNEDNTSNDYDNLDSLPSESITDKMSSVSENNESSLEGNEYSNHESESSHTVSLSDCTNTVINAIETDNKKSMGTMKEAKSRISETIAVFEGDEESNNIWYASASDQEDEEHRDVYRNNPVLECLNQILLQNMNDSLNSPPKTPNIERKSLKHKRVKFCDEEEKNSPSSNNATINTSQNYYETPIQKQPNFYETPQSIYSNDYEQILSKCGEPISNPIVEEKTLKKAVSHQYVHMEIKSEDCDNKIMRKSKILRKPPALPPKPANLTAKYKNQKKDLPSEKSDDSITEFEPDYCSISELNIPQTKAVSFKKINVVAEINAPSSLDVLNKLNLQNDIDNSTTAICAETQSQKNKATIENDIDKIVKTICISTFRLENKSDGIKDAEYITSTNTSEEDLDDISSNIESHIIVANNEMSPTKNNNNKNLNKEQKLENKPSPKDNYIPTNIVDNNNKNYLTAKLIPNEQKRLLGHAAKMDILGKMYFSNDSNVKALEQIHSNEFKFKEENPITDTLVVKKCVEKLNIQLAKHTSIVSDNNKKIELKIPKLPQVSEIIIPDESEEKAKEEGISHDNYVKNNSQIFKLQNSGSDMTRRPIVIGSSVSSLISGFNKQLLSEINKRPERNKRNSNLFSSFETKQNSDKQVLPAKKEHDEIKIENFDLSQNFEEFKLDDCEFEEYTVEKDLDNHIFHNKGDEEKVTTPDLSSSQVELIRARNDVDNPKLNKNSIQVLKKQIELQKSQAQSEHVLSYDKIKNNNEPTYEHFLECTGLSSKSILTPSRMLSNHKSMLKPKDIKLRSKVRTNTNNLERSASSSVKYWSEPYI